MIPGRPAWTCRDALSSLRGLWWQWDGYYIVTCEWGVNSSVLSAPCRDTVASSFWWLWLFCTLLSIPSSQVASTTATLSCMRSPTLSFGAEMEMGHLSWPTTYVSGMTHHIVYAWPSWPMTYDPWLLHHFILLMGLGRAWHMVIVANSWEQKIVD